MSYTSISRLEQRGEGEWNGSIPRLTLRYWTNAMGKVKAGWVWKDLLTDKLERRESCGLTLRESEPEYK